MYPQEVDTRLIMAIRPVAFFCIIHRFQVFLKASQEINSLAPGQLYIVSGDYQRGLGKNTTVNTFGVALDSIFLFETAVPTDSNWHGFSFDYTATSTSALLSLEAQINGVEYSYAIDNIAMYAVPEPNSLCLMGVGGMMSALFFRHRRKARRE